MRDIAAEVSIDLSEIEHAIGVELVALQDGERHQESWIEHNAKRRLKLGRLLCDARKQWPARGPNAKGWGEWLSRRGIGEQSAREWMALAGYMEGKDISKPGVEIPTRNEVNEARKSDAVNENVVNLAERVGDTTPDAPEPRVRKDRIDYDGGSLSRSDVERLLEALRVLDSSGEPALQGAANVIRDKLLKVYFSK